MTCSTTARPAAPIACTLPGGAYAERMAWIADLNRTLLHHMHRDLTLELHYPAAEMPRVRELVRREQSCCAFLDFDVTESSTGAVLRIIAPVDTRAAIEGIFEPFLSGVGAATTVGLDDADRPDARGVSPTCSTARSTTCGDGPSTPCDCSPSAALVPRTSTADLAPGDVDTSAPGRASRVGAITTAGFAVACGVCCLLPFALPAVALTTFGGVIATVARGYRWAVVVAVAAVVTGWAWVLWQSVRRQRAPARSTLRAMALATLLLLMALAWPPVERSIIAFLRS